MAGNYENSSGVQVGADANDDTDSQELFMDFLEKLESPVTLDFLDAADVKIEVGENAPDEHPGVSETHNQYTADTFADTSIVPGGRELVPSESHASLLRNLDVFPGADLDAFLSHDLDAFISQNLDASSHSEGDAFPPQSSTAFTDFERSIDGFSMTDNVKQGFGLAPQHFRSSLPPGAMQPNLLAPVPENAPTIDEIMQDFDRAYRESKFSDQLAMQQQLPTSALENDGLADTSCQDFDAAFQGFQPCASPIPQELQPVVPPIDHFAMHLNAPRSAPETSYVRFALGVGWFVPAKAYGPGANFIPTIGWHVPFPAAVPQTGLPLVLPHSAPPVEQPAPVVEETIWGFNKRKNRPNSDSDSEAPVKMPRTNQSDSVRLTTSATGGTNKQPVEASPETTKTRDDTSLNDGVPIVHVSELAHCTVQRCTCLAATAKVARPRNAFIIFRLDQAAKLPWHTDTAAVSGAASRAWRDADEATKSRYRARAEREKQEHARRNPNYRYEPHYKHKVHFGRKGCACGAYARNMKRFDAYMRQRGRDYRVQGRSQGNGNDDTLSGASNVETADHGGAVATRETRYPLRSRN